MRLSIDHPLRRLSPAGPLAGFVLVALVRALTLPRTLWEMDEVLFARAVEKFDPLGFQPHPPGYPLLVGLGKLINLAFHDPFASLVALSLLSSLVGYWALVAAFRRIVRRNRLRTRRRGAGGGRRRAPLRALAGDAGPGAAADVGPAGADVPRPRPGRGDATLRERAAVVPAAVALGAAASAAVGCRPQLALAVLPMLAVALWQTPGWRRRGEALAAFTLVSLLWFVPLLAATGGRAACSPIR